MKRIILIGILWLISTVPVYALSNIVCVYPEREQLVDYNYFQDGQGGSYTNIFLIVKTKEVGLARHIYSYKFESVPRNVKFIRGNVKGLVIQNAK